LHAVTARLVALAALVLALAACGGGSDDESPQASQGRCTIPSQELVQKIADSMQVEAELRHAQVVRSRDFRNVWFLSAEVVYVNREDGAVATWATSVPAGGTSVYSLETNALQATGWPPAVAAEVKLSLTNDGARESRRCAGRAAA
jgi:hypothetical protein